ncbi:MAG: FAD:protein FMN transferase [Spirochaetales bacterium]|nr:FAD:protein FMN transferase [Spirochaetales bacterium]
MVKKILILSATIALIFLSESCGIRAYRQRRLAISRKDEIPVTVIIYAGSEPDWDGIYGYIREKADLYDYRNPEGPVGLLNKNHTGVLPKEVMDVLSTSINIAKKTNGAFDPTILPLSEIWKFDPESPLPDKQMVEEARSRVGYKNIKIEGRKVTLPAGYSLDLGGIAKGAIADDLSAHLLAKGYPSFLIEAGGDIIVSGLKPGNTQWTIAIQHPGNKEAMLTQLKIGKERKQIAIVTSGNYERFKVVDGKLYHHLIDPKTGYPAPENCSVTVIHDGSCAEADALSTAAFILGFKSGLNFITGYPDTEGLLIREKESGYQAAATDGFPVRPQDLSF